MKKISLCFLLVLIIVQLPVLAFQKKKYPEPKSEINKYEAFWIEVDNLENENRTTDALSKVEEIFILSKKENNVPQTIKSLLYKGKYQNVLQEESELSFINLLKKEIDRSVGEEKALLQSLLAETYAMYFNRNQYKFYNRTALDEKGKLDEDFRTWDLQSIYDEITSLYLASVKEKELLINTSINGYVDILDNVTKETLLLRPTLYDFLVHRAINFFSTKSILITEPANTFKLDNMIYLEEADAFNKVNFKEISPYKNHLYYATVLYQDVLKYRFERPDVEAYLSADLNRLKFVRDNFVGEKKDELFRKSIQQIVTKHPGNKITSSLYYELCKSLKDEIAEEDKDNITFSYVLQLCDVVIKDYPGTIGANNCKALKEDILRKDLSLQTVKYVAPNEPFKAFIKYKNLSSVYCNIVKYNDLGKDFSSLKQEDKIKKLNALPSVKKWRLSLPDKEDYRHHSTEIPLNALPPGEYVLLVSDNKYFSIKEQAVTTTFFTVSSISYVLKNNPNNGSYDVYVLDRTTGLPFPNAKVKTFYSEYDYNLRIHVNKEGETRVTDKNGFVNIKNETKNRTIFFEITYGEEKLNTRTPYYFYSESPYNEPVVTTAHFFTDRSIYRPGQTVYFKSILTEYNKGENTSIKGKNIKVSLRDVNYKEVSTLDLVSNQFGAVEGSFILPLSGLTGPFTLQSEFGSTSIRVEEYKRPTFEVKIDKPAVSCILEEEVKVKGNASTYFGIPITEGLVKYRVIRKTHFPTPRRYYWWIPFPKSADKEIAYGEAQTDKEGNFEILFKAIPDHAVKKSLMPVFTYHITADVTDLGGETRSAEQFVRIGYVGLLADIIIEETWKIEDKNQFQVVTTNLDGEEQNAQVQVKIHKINSPEKVKNKRYWEMPDSYLMSEEEHQKIFPNDEYQNESDPLNWVIEKPVFNKSFFTKEQNKIEFPPNTFTEAGVYRIDLLCETNLSPIEISKIIRIEASDTKQLVFPEALMLSLSKPLKEGDQSFDYKIASSFENAQVFVEAVYDGKVLEREFIRLNNEVKTLTFKLSDEHVGRVDIQAFLVKNNRNYTQSLPVNIPKPSKELQVEWTSFRDKMQPGKKEVWRLKIKGPKGEKVAAELLATMYDASLDAFLPHNFSFNLREKYIRYPHSWKQDNFITAQAQLYGIDWNKYSNYQFLSYPTLNLFGFSFYGYNYMMHKGGVLYKSMGVSESSPLMSASQVSDKDLDRLMDMDAGREEVAMPENIEFKAADQNVEQPLRTNLKETAFFFPNILTDKEGNVVLEFTTPEALTKWKFLGFALDEKLNTALLSKEVVTQKELMVLPHLPRFLREKDEITLTAKVFNVTEKPMIGKATIKLINALTNQDITAQVVQNKINQTFELEDKGSMSVSWTIKVSEDLQAVNYEIFASSGTFTDGEGGFLPVLTNRMLVTETLPMQVLGNQTKNYVLEKLKNNTSKTLKNHQLTLEITENPVWYAIQALPYLMEYPYECAEQTFNRLYANAIAGHIVQSNPAIKRTFELWKNLPDSKALLSNLEKNQELKMLLIEETPWLRSAENESEQKKRIALLFDMNKMAQEQARAMSRIVQMQTPNGGFSWFPGMPDNRYITQYIVSGYAHLINLGVLSVMENTDLKQSIHRAIEYLDVRIVEDLNEIKKQKDYLENDHLGYYSVQYLYARAYFPEIKMNKKTSEAHLYFKNQAKQYWTSRGEQLKSMIAIALNKTDEKAIAQKIIESLRQNAINSEEKGMYWKTVEGGGYYWYNAGIETQALIIEAFDEVGAKPNEINAMKLWLLKQKQVQRWSSTKATAEACYALLLRGSDWLSEERQVEIVVGNHKISSSTVENKEPGTGYFKKKWDGDKITPNMAEIKITGKGEGVSWGAIYWQYFEDLEKITPAQTPLSLSKELYKEIVGEKGVRLEKVLDSGNLKVGDKVIVRIILKSDRNMEFIHLKDMRSAGFEPINVLSMYKRQDGLGYYESTRDAATNFFIDYLPKGIYVFEYPLRVSHKGDFSNGITSVQSMYAPEFSAHSEGVRVKVE